MIRSAIFSPDGLYRYQLSRIWDESKRLAMCIGLNPSKANGEKDDPTIRLLTRVLQYQGYGGFIMVNLYAWITPHPKELFSVANSLGDNDQHIAAAALSTQDQIFCWGNFKGIDYRAKKMMQQFPDALCFGKTSTGSPWHPLALMYKGVKTDEVTLTKYKL